MKYLIVLLLTGCVSISETAYKMPDMDEVVVVRMEHRGFFTPSTAKEWEYQCRYHGVLRTCYRDDSKHVHQDGVANDWGAALLRAAGYVGGAALVSEAAVEAGRSIGRGLSKSGDTINASPVIHQRQSFSPVRLRTKYGH